MDRRWYGEPPAASDIGSYVVNNVSLVIPHPSVAQAAKDPTNGIVQPTDLQNQGSYSISGMVPTLRMNVLCVSMTVQDLKPLVYGLRENATVPVDVDIWPEQLDDSTYDRSPSAGMQLDEIFSWGPQGITNDYPPVFPKLPVSYNMLVNGTQGTPWGRPAIYVLGRRPISQRGQIARETDDEYALCKMTVAFSTSCLTRYNVSYAASTLEAVCDESKNEV